MLLLTLRGTPTLYYGDEIGMENVPIPRAQIQDPWELLTPGLGLGRDPVRTPMQWSAAPNAGFCEPGFEPWLAVAGDYVSRNVSAQADDPQSLLSLTHRLLLLRRDWKALVTGGYRSLNAVQGVFAVERRGEDERLLVALNFIAEEQQWALPGEWTRSSLLLSTRPDRLEGVQSDSPEARRWLVLRPNQRLVLAMV